MQNSCQHFVCCVQQTIWNLWVSRGRLMLQLQHQIHHVYYHYATANVLGSLDPLHELTCAKHCQHAVQSYLDVLCNSLLLHNQVKRFGNPTWRKLMKAVEDPVGGNNHALAQKIAREHPGMQPSSNTYYSIIMVTSPCVE